MGELVFIDCKGLSLMSAGVKILCSKDSFNPSIDKTPNWGELILPGLLQEEGKKPAPYIFSSQTFLY